MPSISVSPDPANDFRSRDGIRRHLIPEPIHLGGRVDPAPFERPLSQSLVDRTAALSLRNALEKAPCIILYDDIDSMGHDW